MLKQISLAYNLKIDVCMHWDCLSLLLYFCYWFLTEIQQIVIYKYILSNLMKTCKYLFKSAHKSHTKEYS